MLNSVELSYYGMILGSNRFPLMPQLPQKILLTSKVVKRDLKIYISIRLSKSEINSIFFTL